MHNVFTQQHVVRATHLFDDVEGKLQPLSLQHGDKMLEEDGEMLMTVSKRNQDGHLKGKY